MTNNINNITNNTLIKNESFNSLSESISNKIRINPILLENISLDKYFSKNDIELANNNNINLQITNKGLYSISKYYDAEWITDIIINFLKINNINSYDVDIIDSTAGIGGNTIKFSKNFKTVHAIEINTVHFDVLNNNLKALSIINCNTYCNNFFNMLDKLISYTNIFFLDPPWGGRGYKNYTYYNLKIGKLELYEAINILFDKNYKYIFLKAPFNLNLSQIHNQIKFKNMNIYNSYKNNMILIIFY